MSDEEFVDVVCTCGMKWRATKNSAARNCPNCGKVMDPRRGAPAKSIACPHCGGAIEFKKGAAAR
jgi:predicted RNA-binding Zn-ribbon protein involved in translation (DUF1610 family)